jgi:flagellar hook-associated protein 2
MAISSLGVGSGILTQDLLDQLREADEASLIRPIDLKIANEKDKQNAYDVLEANIKNLKDSINELKTPLLYDERSVEVVGSSVTVEADANSDIQEFTLDVTQLATKQIEESGQFNSSTDTIASGSGSLNLNIDGEDFTIDYTDTTTLEDLKKSINDIAGDKVSATIVQIGTDDYRLFLNSTDTGAAQDITITDNDGNLSGTQLTDDLTAVQEGVDAEFTFNNQTITRSSNKVDDLITGYHITLQETGVSQVNVKQDRENILNRVNSFVEKYNAAITELNKLTKSSTESDERGIFSADSTIKSLKSTLEDMIGSVGGGVGSLYDYGFDVDRDGKMSFDQSTFEEKLDENPKNVEAFFSGGDYTKADGSVVTLTGAFGEMYEKIDAYIGTNGILDQFQSSLSSTISELEERRMSMVERLDDKYNTLQKQWSAYDAMINKLNSASAMFVELANAQAAAQNNG